MKALELTEYPRLKWPRNGAEIEPYRKQWRQERKVVESKRLTDPELAAEYFRQAGSRFEARSADWLATLHRFATLPHYDEPQP